LGLVEAGCFEEFGGEGLGFAPELAEADGFREERCKAEEGCANPKTSKEIAPTGIEDELVGGRRDWGCVGGEKVGQRHRGGGAEDGGPDGEAGRSGGSGDEPKDEAGDDGEGDSLPDAGDEGLGSRDGGVL